jgi:hypothetical protein
MGKYLKLNIVLPVLFLMAAMLFTIVQPAYADFDAQAQAQGVLKFVALIILIAAAVGALTMLTRGLIVQAIVLVIGASLLYFLLADTSAIQNIGSGLNSLIFGGGGE